MQLFKVFLNKATTPVIFLTSLLLSSLSTASGLQKLNIYGSNTIGSQLVPALAQSFLQSQGHVNIQLRSNPSTYQHTITAGINPAQPSVRIDIHTHGVSTSFTALSDSISNDLNGIGFISLPYVPQAKALAVSAGGAGAMYPSNEYCYRRLPFVSTLILL